MTYLRDAPDVERPAEGEQATIDGIIAGMTQQSRTVEAREHHAVRASHAKSSACAVGELTIAPNLPQELAQGLFANPGTYPVAIWFAVATIRLPRQDAYSQNRVHYFDEVMIFRPAHSLVTHRPLGSVMRARLQVYRVLSDVRHRKNGVRAEDTRRIDQVPA